MNIDAQASVSPFGCRRPGILVDIKHNHTPRYSDFSYSNGNFIKVLTFKNKLILKNILWQPKK